MNTEITERGFVIVTHEKYLKPYEITRLIQESSAIGDYSNSYDNPGSSFLWVGQDHHLNREEITDLITKLQQWLDTGRLKINEEDDEKRN